MKSLITINLLLTHDRPFANRSAVCLALRDLFVGYNLTVDPHSPRSVPSKIANARVFLPITILEN